MRWLWVALLVTGCYHPDPAPGAPCSADNKLCPAGLICRGGLCVDPATPFDAATDARVIDARMLDARPDALDDSIGCADGSREAFADRSAYPTLAGCAATWSGSMDLRAAKAGVFADPDTWIASDTLDGCGSLPASAVTGVMCCHD